MSNSTLPNPENYLNHLPPARAKQFEVARNVYLTVLGAGIWDILVYIPDDIKILRKGLGLTTACFVLSRVFTMTYVFLYAIMLTHPIANCRAMILTAGIICLLSMTTTSFLFLRRAQAIYAENRPFQWIFSILWLAISVSVVGLLIGTDAEHIRGTNYCIIYRVKSYVSVCEFLPAIFDSLVFFAISYKMATAYNTLDARITWDTLISGRALPRLSRAILRGGQQYYLIAFTFNIASGALLYSPSIPPTYRTLIAVPSSVLSSSMACRVYRNIKDFDEKNKSTLPVISDLNFRRGVTGVSEKTTTQGPVDLRSVIPGTASAVPSGILARTDTSETNSSSELGGVGHVDGLVQNSVQDKPATDQP